MSVIKEALTLPETALVALSQERAQNKIQAAQSEQAQYLQTIFTAHKVPEGVTVDIDREDDGTLSLKYTVPDAEPKDSQVVGEIKPADAVPDCVPSPS